MTNNSPLVKVQELKKYYDNSESYFDRLFNTRKKPVRAVDGVSFDVYSGETFGLVGESGCGKSTTGRTMLRLHEATAGCVEFGGKNIFKMDRSELIKYRRNAQMVFQEPFSSINPRMTIGDCIAEPLDVHGANIEGERETRVDELLENVGLSTGYKDRYAHEFSGGQCQRIGIARALALKPEFIVLDEPVSALDVSVQAQIMNLLIDLQNEFNLTYLFIAHDLSVIKYMCDRVAVMYLGEIVEIGPVDQIFEEPKHPYTRALVENISRADPEERYRDIEILTGDVPSPRDPPSGCRFRTRCPKVISPHGYDLGQETWRRIMDLRQDVEKDTVDLESILQSFEVQTNPNTMAEVKSPLRSYYDIPEQLNDPAADKALTRALTFLTEDQMEKAQDYLSTKFSTRCEKESPEPVNQGESSLVSCHLYTSSGNFS